MGTVQVGVLSGAGAGLPDAIFSILQAEPGVGVSIIDASGVVRFLNDRAAELFLGVDAAHATGRTLDDLYGEEWAAERLALYQRILESGRPGIIRHIRRGRRLQSTVWPLSGLRSEVPVFLVLTVAGEAEPADPERFEILESDFAHLGPLEPLTKRELEVLALLGHGMNTGQVAAALHRSPRTIERHCDSLRSKLNSTNRVQLAAFARRAALRVEDAERKRVS